MIFCRCLNVSRSLERPKQLHVQGSRNPSSLDSKNHTLGHTSSRTSSEEAASLLCATHNGQIVLRSSKMNLAVLVGEFLRVFRQEYLLDFSLCVCVCVCVCVYLLQRFRVIGQTVSRKGCVPVEPPVERNMRDLKLPQRRCSTLSTPCRLELRPLPLEGS